MEIALGILSVLLIAAILIIPRPKTKLEKLIHEHDKNCKDDPTNLFF